MAYFENNDDIYSDDSDTDSTIELVNYVNETNKHVEPTGKVKNQYIFEDTAKLFGSITNKRIDVIFNEGMRIKTSKYGNIEKALITNIRKQPAFELNIPVNHRLADNEQDIYSYFLMRPLAQVFGKTDSRNLEILLADNTRLYNVREATEEIWKTTEAHRIESFYNKLRLGTYADIQRLNKKSFNGRKIDNIIDAVKAIHAKREELIPKKYADLIKPVSTLLKRVERSDPTATNIITKRIFDIVEQELKKEKQKEQQAQSKKEQKEKEKREKEAKEAPTEQQLPTPEQLQQEQEVIPQVIPSTLNARQNQERKEQEERDNKLTQAAKKSARKDAKNQNYSNLEIQTEPIDTKKEIFDFTSETKLDEMLDKSNEKGEEMIDDLNEKLTQVEKENKPEEVRTNFAAMDQALTHKDEIGVSRPQKDFDVVLSRQLRHMFINMRSKFSHIRSDSSGIMNIQRTIQYMAGDKEAKIYDRKIRQTGINIRFLVDCSSSMSSKVNDSDESIPYVQRKSKMSASKELLITMLEATKGLEKFIDLKVLAYGASGHHASVPEVDRKRIETLADDGSTPTAQGIRQAHLDLKKCKQGQKLIIHLTDGEPNDIKSAKGAIMAAEKEGIKIFTVMLPSTERLDHARYKTLEYLFGKGKFEPIFNWSSARRTMMHKVANSITSMLQGY